MTATLPTVERPDRLTDVLLKRLAHEAAGHGAPSTVVEVFTGRPLVDVPTATPDDVAAAVERARRAQRAWAQVPVRQRVGVVERWLKEVAKERDTILDLIQAETGKARFHAEIEAFEPVLTGRYYVRTAEALLAPQARAGLFPLMVKVQELRQPKGVVGIISPWNFPFALGLSDSLPALLAGNAVVLKPDAQTPLTVLFGRELLIRAGLPRELFQIVVGDGPVTGGAVVDTCDYVGFTGSTATGRAVASRAAGRLIGYSLELGGKNPMIVLPDADLGATVPGALTAAFANAGQVCLCIERLYVHRSIHDEFVEQLVEATRALAVGPGYNYGADIGSLISPRQLVTVTAHVDDALERGATALVGGRARPDLGPSFFEPTVLAGVTEGMRCFRNETFGPVVTVRAYDDVDEAVALANDTEYGLNASVWGRNTKRAREVGARLRAGTVNVNDGFGAAYASIDAPMGGMGNSGVGRRHGAEGLLKYTEAQTVAQAVVPLDAPAWLPKEHFATAMRVGNDLLRRTGLR
ncbi:MAG: succinic semialdehyde dehydrogenase [Jatrophihabitans sp.]|uniref:succinic semialdehyde dehydrogenase n=1 Tax=Jatrophihabitans sp. TaxID=1932789 RepID=UPI003F7F0401